MECCVFIHYSQDPELSPVDFHYVNELAGLFPRVILATNEREFHPQNLPRHVEIRQYKNEGYDFGMFCKVVRELDLQDLDRLILANDSNILIGDLEELIRLGSRLNVDIWGALDSYERPWFSTHAGDFHLQSHFLVWEKTGLSCLQTFLEEYSFDSINRESDLAKIRRQIINDWEIGFSQYALGKGLQLQAVHAAQQVGTRSGIPVRTNFAMKYPELLLEHGYPFLKKKFISRQTAWQRLFVPKKRWENLIRDYCIEPSVARQMLDYLQNQRKK